jgi:hypothetical protein
LLQQGKKKSLLRVEHHIDELDKSKIVGESPEQISARKAAEQAVCWMARKSFPCPVEFPAFTCYRDHRCPASYE